MTSLCTERALKRVQGIVTSQLSKIKILASWAGESNIKMINYYFIYSMSYLFPEDELADYIPPKVVIHYF